MKNTIGAIALLLSVPFMPGCVPRNIQAPFDGFVCYSQSFADCASNPRTKDLRRYYSQTFSKQQLVDDVNSFSAKDVKTDDGKYTCKMGSVPYEPKLNRSKVFDIVFVSPVLISQLGEQEVRLKRAREACTRTIKAYEFHRDLISVQDKAAKVNSATTKIAAEVEFNRLTSENIAVRPLTEGEADALGLTRGTMLREALKLLRERGVDLNEEVRSKANIQTIEVEYEKLFDDANLLIEAQLRELGRQLFVLDRSVLSFEGTAKNVGYDNGSWVQKGTIVLEVKK